MNLKDLFKLAGDNGKLVFVDEEGSVKGVFLNWPDYQKITRTNLPSESESEQVNKQIIQAQLESDLGSHPNLETLPEEPVEMPEPVSDILSRRASELFNSKPFGRAEEPEFDLRSEVVDPSFGKEDLAEADTEEIKPQFDDI